MPVNFYKRHLGDYAKDTRHLNFIEHGAYTLLLDLYYGSEEPLPYDLEEICRRTGARSKQEREAIASILRQFFKKEARANQHGSRLVATQRRVEGEIAEYKRIVKIGKINGLKGGRPKTKNNHTPFENETQINHSQNQNQSHNAGNGQAVPPLKDSPLPPAVAGDEKFFEWARETVAVRMGQRRRLPSFDAYQGGRADDLVQFLNRKGFQARIVRVQ